MNNLNELIFKIENDCVSWEDLSEIISLDDNSTSSIIPVVQKITQNNFGNKLKIYIPGKRFPAISLTGNKCSLHCEHCNEKYLDGMRALLKNSELETFLLSHRKNGGVGALISGGCDTDGAVPLFEYLDTIKRVKETTNLIINAHTGLLNEITAQKLAEVGIDIVSFDVNMDEDVITDIYHLRKNLDDNKKAVLLLQKYELNIVPHICIGIFYGNLHKELDSLKFIKDIMGNPPLIVLIALIPPKGKQSLFNTPDPLDIAKIVLLTRIIFPKTEISLGCMRPRGAIKTEIEKLAIQSGINRIEIPSSGTIKWLKSVNPDVELEYFSACCAIPRELEFLAVSNELEIKKYKSS